MLDISSEMSSVLQSTEVILVFVIFLFTLFYKDIEHSIKVERTDGEYDNKRIKSNVRSVFWGKNCALLISMFIAFCLLFPMFLEIITNLPSNLDYITYSFLCIFIFQSVFFIWSIWLSYQILDNIKELGDYDRFETLKYVLKRK